MIGGVLAAAQHGPFSAGFGLVRDYCIGVEFVTGEGAIAAAGGTVVKNVAGYDLMKLLIGSRGSLGIITEASFKVFARPLLTKTYVALFDEPNGAVEYALAVRRSVLHPVRLEFAGNTDGGWQVMVTANGSERVQARYRAELGKLGRVEREFSGEDEVRLWSGELGAGQEACVELWCPLAKVSNVVERFSMLLKHGGRIRGRVGLGHVEVEAKDAGWLRREVEALPSDLLREWRRPRSPLHLGENTVARRIKETMDPHGILNPGATV